MTAPDAEKFFADSMLGSLARWLRIMGYDTRYDKDLADADIMVMAKMESRAILTRDRELARAPGAFLVESDVLDEQLSAVAERYGLAFKESETRCSGCNGELRDTPKGDVSGKVPDGAFTNNDRFWTCKSCGKLFWKGSHWIGITERFERLSLSVSRDREDAR